MAGTAHTIHGAIKTGKAISAAAKGAAVGGPYGAAAGLVLGAGRHAGKFLAVAAVLLMLPMLFLLMLPSSVLDLNASIAEKDTARRNYVTTLYNYWSLYYTLRSLTLYDFENNKPLSEDLDKIVDNQYYFDNKSITSAKR